MRPACLEDANVIYLSAKTVTITRRESRTVGRKNFKEKKMNVQRDLVRERTGPRKVIYGT